VYCHPNKTASTKRQQRDIDHDKAKLTILADQGVKRLHSHKGRKRCTPSTHLGREGNAIKTKQRQSDLAKT